MCTELGCVLKVSERKYTCTTIVLYLNVKYKSDSVFDVKLGLGHFGLNAENSTWLIIQILV